MAIAMTTLGDRIFFSYPDSALNLFDRSEKLFQQILQGKNSKDPLKKQLNYYLAALYSDRGSIYLQKGDIPFALSYYNQAMFINEEQKNEYGIASNLSNIGYIYLTNLNDLNRAYECYDKALKITNKLGKKYRWLAGNILSIISEIYFKKNDIPLALEYIEKSLNISQQEGNLTGMADAFNNRAKVYLKLNKISQAIGESLKSNSFYEKAGDKEGYSKNLILLGELYFKQNNFSLAEEQLSEAIKTARENNYRSIIKEASSLLQKIYFRQGKWKESAEMAEMNNQIRDSIENTGVSMKILRDLIYFENRNEALRDSIRFISAQREKDKQIQKQQLQNEEQKLLRNAIIFGLIGLIVMGAILFNRYRISRQQKENILQITALETEQKLLRAQMNPHFINNSLNSIQSLILENEPIEAGEYLATFSRLTRAIMDQTNKKSIPLGKEIETLKMYLEMEMLRFSDKFDFKIELHPDVNPENLFIPPLLIQPFVENSILHGIIHLEGKGEIIVSFKKNNVTLTCTITDNGIGREKSKEINSQKMRQGNSMATELAKNRLRLMNRNPSRGVRIIDLKNEKLEAIGTRVILNIPLITKET